MATSSARTTSSELVSHMATSSELANQNNQLRVREELASMRTTSSELVSYTVNSQLRAREPQSS